MRILNSRKSSITLGENADIIATFIKKDAELKKAALPLADQVAQELMKEDAARRKDTNDAATSTLTELAQKKKDGWAKVRKGGLSALRVAGIFVITALTDGATLPLLAVSLQKARNDMSDMFEGIDDIMKANRGDSSQSFNFVRDKLYGGNQDAYDISRGITNFLYDIVSAHSLARSYSYLRESENLPGFLKGIGDLCKRSKLANFSVNISGDVLANMYYDFMNNGKITFESILSGAFSGTLKGFGSTLFQSLPCLKNIENTVLRKIANTIVGTAVGVGVDWSRSKLRGEEFNAGASTVLNLILTGVAQALGEPIDAASGAYFITVHEFILPDVLTPIYLTRKYFSSDGKSGWLGKGWRFSYEGRLCRDEEAGILHVQLPDGYCAAYEMVESGNGGILYRDTIGNGRYRLSHEDMADLWNVTDTHQFKTYCYNAEGLLVSVVDKNGGCLEIEYNGEFPQKLITPLGYTIDFTFRDGRLVELKDGMGRTVAYRYEDGLLTEVVHMDGGVSHYAYTAEGYLEAPTDQTGLTYLTNAYDEKGRVVKQTLADGSIYRLQLMTGRDRSSCSTAPIRVNTSIHTMKRWQ